mgnify:FL=1
MADTDVLEILDILSRLGINDKRMEEAINLVISKQDVGADGSWIILSTGACKSTSSRKTAQQMDSSEGSNSVQEVTQ